MQWHNVCHFAHFPAPERDWWKWGGTVEAPVVGTICTWLSISAWYVAVHIDGLLVISVPYFAKQEVILRGPHAQQSEVARYV